MKISNIQKKYIPKAILIIAGSVLFSFVIYMNIPEFNSFSLIVYSAILVITCINLFREYRLLKRKPEEEENKQESLTPGKKKLKAVFYIYFFSAWLIGAAFFSYTGYIYNRAPEQKTETRTVEMNNHGDIKYISEKEAAIKGLLGLAFFFFIPTALIFGLIMEKGLKIPVISDKIKSCRVLTPP
ncbi:MAG: hypothetical protein GY754_38765 [bacterium]|nr:hypothetical protein [bacterium]